jgi:alpha-L-fucosidase
MGIPAWVRAVIDNGPFHDTWASLSGYQVPEWYKDGKLGIFVHWGAYSVPAFGNEWYPRNMYVEGSPEFEHHRKVFGDQREFGYKDLIERFSAQHFDPAAWAGLFRRAGAQFVVPVAEHHDGFAMYDCSRSRWSASRMGPGRDVVGELAEAVRSQWLVFGVSSHRAEHWWFFNGGMRYPSDVQEPAFGDLYGPAQPESLPPNEEFLEDWLLRTCELVDKYRPQLVWFDWWIEQPAFEPYLRAFAAYYYNRAAAWGRGVAINYKKTAFPDGTAVFDVERGQLGDIAERFWQADTAVARNSWGYVDGLEYKEPVAIIQDFVDIVSKNGALLLNVGPASDGTIPAGDRSILEALGAWLQVNGEAIYGTRPWRRFGEGPTAVVGGSFQDTARGDFRPGDIRYTSRGTSVVYAVVLSPSDHAPVRLRSLGSAVGWLAGRVERVSVLGHRGGVEWLHDEDMLEVDLPPGVLGTLPAGPVIIKVEMAV